MTKRFNLENQTLFVDDLDGLSFFHWNEVGLLLTFCLDGMKCFEMLPGIIKSFRSTMKAIVR